MFCLLLRKCEWKKKLLTLHKGQLKLICMSFSDTISGVWSGVKDAGSSIWKNYGGELIEGGINLGLDKLGAGLGIEDDDITNSSSEKVDSNPVLTTGSTAAVNNSSTNVENGVSDQQIDNIKKIGLGLSLVYGVKKLFF